MEFKNATFLVTGGSSGIGLATAKALIAQGANVAITGRDEKKLKTVAEEIGALGIPADVANQKDVDATFDEVLATYGKLDGLINNAGIGGGWGEISELDMEAMRKIYDVNVFGAAMMGKRAAAIFKAQESGNIVNIASTAGVKGFGMGTIYASSKFALRGMTQCWQGDLRKYNVRVTLINPSEVTTAFNNEAREERPEDPKKLSSKEIADAIIGVLALDDRGFVPEVTVWASNPF